MPVAAVLYDMFCMFYFRVLSLVHLLFNVTPQMLIQPPMRMSLIALSKERTISFLSIMLQAL